MRRTARLQPFSAAFFCVFAFLCFSSAAAAQVAAPIQVFLVRDITPDGRDQLVFIDLATGSETTSDADGDHYTLLPDAVLFNERAPDASVPRPTLAYPDGRVAPHPFIVPRAATRRIDWVLSSDRARIAWTLTDGSPSAITTTTEIARLDGTDRRVVFADSAREGIRAFPVALFDDRLIMDYQPDTLGDLTPFRQYAGLFAVDLVTGLTTPLPDEPGCFCGAAVSARLFVRMGLAADRPGYELRIIDAETGARRVVPPPGLDSYTQGGDVLMSPDGTRAVYALAQIQGFGTAAQRVQTVFMSVDLTSGTQRALTAPVDALLRPAAWTDDGRAILLTTPTGNGTWRLEIDDPVALVQLIADAVYLGTLLS
ncbi:MAG: hypothetical protein SGI73_15580 [Chloroflexota bacterium]|nr:hypothetical protein [Chloroflexota bacterium]